MEYLHVLCKERDEIDRLPYWKDLVIVVVVVVVDDLLLSSLFLRQLGQM
jgi:hypothetical protein